MVYILQIYNKCTTFPNQIVITIISGAKFFAKILQIKTNYSGRASHLKLHERLANLKSVTKKLRENKEMNWHFDIFYLTL